MPTFLIDLQKLPVAALASRDNVIVAMSPAVTELTGWREDEIVGRTSLEIIAQFIAPRDHAVLAQLAQNRDSPAPLQEGRLWCRVRTAKGEELPVRVEWRLDENGHDSLVTITDAAPEAFGQEVTEALARVAGALSRCATEEDVLSEAVNAVCERGFVATILLIDEHDPLLRYGPSRTPGLPAGRPVDLPRPSKEILTTLNPAFMERRAALFLDGMRIVREAYPEPIADKIQAFLTTPRMVQAPLFVGDAPYGALVVSGAALSPLVATALDLFAELVGKAVENVRLRGERVERERLAALGEAAGVMAHEVRNPVGSIMNALALLKRERHGGDRDQSLLAIISEETARLEQLVTQLLDLGRPLLPRPCHYSIEELTRRAAHVLTTRGELAGRTLDFPTTDETNAFIDPDLVELAMVNVLRNAVQSTKSAARVRIRVGAAAAFVSWTVEDEGTGIPEEVAKRLGQPFVTTRATGTGMGLAVVRRIMEASHGELTVDRAALGGAKVVLMLPRAD